MARASLPEISNAASPPNANGASYVHINLSAVNLRRNVFIIAGAM
jgi:hypothetical protein